MSRIPCRLLVLFLAAIVSARAATIARSYSGITQSLSLNGVTCPEVVSWSGGDASASVVLEPAAAGASAKKHLGSLAYEPIVVQVTLPFSPPLLDCMADLCANRTNRKTLLLGNIDATGRAVGTSLQATNALLMEVKFPALDAGSKEVLYVVLIFQPEQTQSLAPAPSGAASAGRPVRALASNFKFSLSSLDATSASRIEAFTIKRSLAVGQLPSSSLQTGPAEFPNLAITLADFAPADWIAWREDFVAKGNNDDPKERSGSLEILSPDLRTVLFSLQLSHVGIMRFSSQVSRERLSRSRADLYCEGMSASNGNSGTPASSPTSTTAPTAADDKTAPPSTPPAPPPAGTATTPADANANAEDKGQRDPLNFPRPPGTVRTLYTAVRQKGFVQEVVGYTARTNSESIIGFYEKALGGDGWEEVSRNENNYGTKGAHQMLSTWKKSNRTASFTLVDTAPGSAEIQATVEARQ